MQVRVIQGQIIDTCIKDRAYSLLKVCYLCRLALVGKTFIVQGCLTDVCSNAPMHAAPTADSSCRLAIAGEGYIVAEQACIYSNHTRLMIPTSLYLHKQG